jgi:phosphoserine / homoserine phosphotransferase
MLGLSHQRREAKVPRIICLDLEGVLVPEVWIAFAEATKLPELRRTTRDEPDYDKLMRGRLQILAEHGLTLSAIQEVIGTLEPLPGALEFLDQLRAKEQVLILSDTFYQFALPLMKKLRYPTLFCHELVVDGSDRITNYRLRLADSKKQAILRLRELGFATHAAGDSYNDTSMLGAADRGVLFRCPDNVARDFPQFPRTTEYEALFSALVG